MFLPTLKEFNRKYHNISALLDNKSCVVFVEYTDGRNDFCRVVKHGEISMTVRNKDGWLMIVGFVYIKAIMVDNYIVPHLTSPGPVAEGKDRYEVPEFKIFNKRYGNICDYLD